MRQKQLFLRWVDQCDEKWTGMRELAKFKTQLLQNVRQRTIRKVASKHNFAQRNILKLQQDLFAS